MVVTVVVFIVSEKVTERDDEIETEVSESDGEVEETVSDVVSAVLVVDSSFSPQEKMVRLKRSMEKMMSKCLIGSLIRNFRRTLHVPQFEGNLQEGKMRMNFFLPNNCDMS